MKISKLYKKWHNSSPTRQIPTHIKHFKHKQTHHIDVPRNTQTYFPSIHFNSRICWYKVCTNQHISKIIFMLQFAALRQIRFQIFFLLSLYEIFKSYICHLLILLCSYSSVLAKFIVVFDIIDLRSALWTIDLKMQLPKKKS